MLRSAFLMMGLIVLTTVSSASAAVVGFRGVLLTNPVAPTGSLNLPLGNFTLNLTTGVPLATSTITGGAFNFNGTPVTVSGGIVAVSGGNTLSFTVLSSPNIISTFTFTGLSGLPGVVNQAALDQLGPGNSANFTILQTDISGNTVLGQYDGTISGVPEPASCSVLCGLVMGAAAWRVRKRRLAKA